MAQADSKGPVKNAYFYYVEEVADLHGYNVDTNFEAMARKFGGDWVVSVTCQILNASFKSMRGDLSLNLILLCLYRKCRRKRNSLMSKK